ncbi:hypothetical protein G7092_15180 [Mucilaginibacter sp. HC2]|uniref:IPT/TIG domain-containing protein n=1 Tax=Mucilaginibacter inviolabilis TaxID=2714892 RepID=UPI00140C3EBE|nr:IPT/TIG domain-containing protein [Mucilaginibacter inviolabilis]NHA05151.1 hypothetical protein [Mucilaginibacter inviolabilis]
MRKKTLTSFAGGLMLIMGLLFLIVSCKKDHNNKDGSVPLGSAGPLTMMPTSGNAGTLVTISGSGFSTNAADNTVTFNGKQANVVNANASQLVVQAPQGGSTGTVQVSVSGKSATAGTYTFQALSIHSIEPFNGPTGTNVRIIGAGFGSTTAPAQVTINGAASTVTSAADTLLIVAVPTNAGTGPVVVKVNGQTATGPVFTYQAISAISPLTGGPGTVVTITGTGFNTVTAQNVVAVNGVAAIVNSASSTSITATLQAGVSTGPVSVSINGERTAGPVFTVVPPPLIASVSPTSGLAGVQVTINGNYFSTVLTENQVTFNGISAVISSASVNKLVVNAPANVTTGKIVITTNQQVTTGPVFTVQSLGVSSLSPDNGLDGTVVTITGTGFNTTASQNQVYFNGNAATVTSATATTLVVTAPVGTTTGPITVKANGLTATGPVFTHAGVSTLAGGPKVKTLLNRNISNMVIDSKGNLFLTNGNNVLEASPTGVISVFAGSTTGDTGFQDGTGTGALFQYLIGITIDNQDNLYVADINNNAIRKITPSGVVSTYKTITGPVQLAFDSQGTLYIGQSNNVITKYQSNGLQIVMTTQANNFKFVIDAAGNLYYGGAYDNAIHMVNPSGVEPYRFYAGNYGQNLRDGGPGIGSFSNIAGLAIDPTSQNLIVADRSGSNAIRIVTPDRNVTTLTGGNNYSGQAGFKDGGLSSALFNSPSAVAVDKNGTIYVMDAENAALRKVATH